MDIREEIISFSKSIKIDLIGFCDICFPEDLIKILRERRKMGHLSGFEEQNENKRIDIKSIMDNAKTVISIAVPYRTCNVDTSFPYLSKSSLGIDYHRVVMDKLKKISNFIKSTYGEDCMEFCDIGPLCEREIAAKCGIGFIGKNSNIITEKYGSYVFLGEILTSLYIERSASIYNKCGNCSLCINICPVKAIEGPYHINAKKCLSYVTQKKEILEAGEMNDMGLRIYGCDTCQDICPYNKYADFSQINEFKPEDWNININIEDIIKMSKGDFQGTFYNTSLGWRGKNVLKRNSIISAGNSMNKKYISILKEYKSDSEVLKYYINRSIKKLEEDGYE